MSCDPNQLLELIDCFETKVWGSLANAVEVVLLCAIRDGTPLACDPQTLIDQANCLLTTIPPGAYQPIKLALLCQILAGTAGGGGGGQVMEYTGTDPTSDGLVPTDQNLPAVAYSRTGAGSTFSWNTVTHVWV